VDLNAGNAVLAACVYGAQKGQFVPADRFEQAMSSPGAPLGGPIPPTLWALTGLTSRMEAVLETIVAEFNAN